MKAIFQAIIQLFRSLFKSRSQAGVAQPPTTKPTTAPPSAPKPQPAPATPPVVEAPATPAPEPVAEEPPVPTPAEPEVVAPAPAGPLDPKEGLEFKTVGETKISITDGEVEGIFRKFVKEGSSWKGWYTRGQRTIKDFIQSERDLLDDLNMTESARNLLQSVSENEGNLDAINAYDGAFLSFGIFQWTLGLGDSEGELPALLKKLKAQYPETFHQYFGRFGLDVADRTNKQTGYLTLNGQLINTPERKTQFRSMHWVYRFWRAGRDRLVQAIEVQHALSRLETFYWKHEAHGFTLNKIITSEYGVALLLDNHVNVPAQVRLALQRAMQETGLTDPTNWESKQERQVLKSYVNHRATKIGKIPPMYDAKNRAKRTAAYVSQGVISDERGSLKLAQTRARSLDNFVPEPVGYDPEDYRDMEMETEGRDMEFLSGSGEDI